MLRFYLATLSIVIFCNLNGVFFMIFGVEAPFSLIMLWLSLSIIYTGVVKFKVTLNDKLLKRIAYFFVTYLFVASISLLIDNSGLHEKTSVVLLYRSYTSSVVIIAAYYVGFRVILTDKNTNIIKYLTPLLIFTTCFTIIASMVGLTAAYEYNKKGFDNERSIGFFANPNEAGVFACYAMVFFIANIYIVKKKYLYIIMAIISAFSAFSTFSKSAFFSVLLIVILYFVMSFFYFSKSNLKTRIYNLFFFMVIFFFANYLLLNLNNLTEDLTLSQQYRVTAIIDLFNGEINEQTTSERDGLFEHGIEKIMESPFFGNGFGSFHQFATGPKRLGVHNTYLMIWGESGFFPFLIFLSFIFLMIRDSKYLPFYYKFLVAGILIVFLSNEAMTTHNSLQQRPSNAIFGAIIALIAYYKPKYKNPSTSTSYTNNLSISD